MERLHFSVEVVWRLKLKEEWWSPLEPCVFISIHRALLSGGKPLLLGEECDKAEPSQAPHMPSLGLLHSTQELIIPLLVLQGKLRVWRRFGVLSSCSIQDFFWEEFVAWAAGEEVKSPKWEVSPQSCTTKLQVQICIKMGTRELQLQGRYLRLFLN